MTVDPRQSRLRPGAKGQARLAMSAKSSSEPSRGIVQPALGAQDLPRYVRISKARNAIP